MKFKVLSFLFLFISLAGFSQISVDKIDDTMKSIGRSNRLSDTSYVKYYDEVGIHLYSVLNSNSFSILDDQKGNQLKYGMAKSPSMGIGFNKYGVTLNLANDFGVLKQDEKKFGETKKFIINTSFVYNKFSLNVYLTYFRGYYISNTDEFEIYRNDVVYPQRSDVRTVSFGLSNFHVLNNKKFSMNASYTLTQKQLKSAGSVILGEFFNMFNVVGDSSLIPDSLMSEFSPYASFNKSSLFLVGVSAGYSYTFVFFDDFSFNITALPSLLIANSNWTADDAKYNSSQISIRPNLIFKSALAFVGDRNYIGLSSSMNSFFAGAGNDNGISYNIINFKFFAGHRIGSRKKN